MNNNKFDFNSIIESDIIFNAKYTRETIPLFDKVLGIFDAINSLIKKLVVNTKVMELYDSITNNEKVSIYSNDGELLCNKDKMSEQKISTGDYIEYFNETQNKVKIYLSVAGDLSGDGEVDSLDLASMMNHISGKRELSDVYLTAGYLNNDEDIDSLDLAYLMNHIAGKEGY